MGCIFFFYIFSKSFHDKSINQLIDDTVVIIIVIIIIFIMSFGVALLLELNKLMNEEIIQNFEVKIQNSWNPKFGNYSTISCTT